jgi:hypothetical protein
MYVNSLKQLVSVFRQTLNFAERYLSYLLWLPPFARVASVRLKHHCGVTAQKAWVRASVRGDLGDWIMWVDGGGERD